MVFNGVHAPENDKDNYSLSYAHFVMPLVKAVQEQQEQIKTQDQLIKTQGQLIEELRKEVNALKAGK